MAACGSTVSTTRGTTALVYCLINSSLYTGTVHRWWSTPNWLDGHQGCSQLSTSYNMIHHCPYSPNITPADFLLFCQRVKSELVDLLLSQDSFKTSMYGGCPDHQQRRVHRCHLKVYNAAKRASALAMARPKNNLKYLILFTPRICIITRCLTCPVSTLFISLDDTDRETATERQRYSDRKTKSESHRGDREK